MIIRKQGVLVFATCLSEFNGVFHFERKVSLLRKIKISIYETFRDISTIIDVIAHSLIQSCM